MIRAFDWLLMFMFCLPLGFSLGLPVRFGVCFGDFACLLGCFIDAGFV